MYCPKCGKEIVSGEAFCRNCGSPANAASPVAGQERKTKAVKGPSALYLVGGTLLVLFVIGALSSESEPAQPAENSVHQVQPQLMDRAPTQEELAAAEAQKKADEEATAAAKLKDLEYFKNELEGYIDGLPDNEDWQYKNTQSDLTAELNMFKLIAGLVQKAESHDDPGIKKLGAALRKKLVQSQKQEFPLLRKAYAVLVAKQLWVKDIDVRAYGTAYASVEFVASPFASRQAIVDVHKSLEATLMAFRFKKAYYKWYSGDDGYFYDLASLADSELPAE